MTFHTTQNFISTHFKYKCRFFIVNCTINITVVRDIKYFFVKNSLYQKELKCVSYI